MTFCCTLYLSIFVALCTRASYYLANYCSSIETMHNGGKLAVHAGALQGDMAGNQMSTGAMRFVNVENGGNANVQSSIETTKVWYGAKFNVYMNTDKSGTVSNPLSKHPSSEQCTSPECHQSTTTPSISRVEWTMRHTRVSPERLYTRVSPDCRWPSHGGMYPFAYVEIDQSVEQAFILWTMRFTILHQFTHLRWEWWPNMTGSNPLNHMGACTHLHMSKLINP